MSLHIIVDGYNLIRTSHTLSVLDAQDLQSGREALIDQLAHYKRIKSHRITVVFDGADIHHQMFGRDRQKGILVVFSKASETADDVIARMASQERGRALIVSSDRQLVRNAAAKGCAIIDASEFEERLWMAGYLAQKGVDLKQEDRGWVATTRKKGPKYRLKKHQRRNQQKIRKL